MTETEERQEIMKEQAKISFEKKSFEEMCEKMRQDIVKEISTWKVTDLTEYNKPRKIKKPIGERIRDFFLKMTGKKKDEDINYDDYEL